MGEFVDRSARGRYYLATRGQSPFSANPGLPTITGSSSLDSVQGSTASPASPTAAAADVSRRDGALGVVNWAVSQFLQCFWF